MTKTRFASLLTGAAFIALSFAGCTDWSYTGNKFLNTETQLEQTTGTRTAVDVNTNKLYKIYTTTDPTNATVNNPISTRNSSAKEEK